jgi:hypothetical protein
VSKSISKPPLLKDSEVDKLKKSFTKKQWETVQEHFRKKLAYRHAGRSTSSKSIFLLSDMHCGAVSAIMWEPRGNEESKKKHRALKAFWDSMPDQWENKTQTCLIINGEPINGPSRKQNGGENWTSDVNLQLDDAEKLIRQFRYKSVLLTRGSGYHSTDGQTNFEENLARRLGAIPYIGMFGDALNEHQSGKSFLYGIKDPGARFGQHTDYYLWLGVHDKLFSITHHIGFSRWQSYRTTGIAAEMSNINHLRGRYFPENMECTNIIRSHVHYQVLVSYGTQNGYTTPCWKLADSFQYKGGMAASNGHVGGCEVLIESNGKTTYNKITMPNADFPKYEVVWL